MLYAKYRDFDPKEEYRGHTLGLMIHDDGDVIKWDWAVYKFFGVEQFNTSDDKRYTNEMYEQITTLDISPYERDMSTIRDKFMQFVDMNNAEYYWHEGPLFS